MADEIPEWAAGRVSDLFGAEHDGKGGEHAYTVLSRAFARYIAAHEEPPVDPLLIEARKLLILDHTGGHDLWHGGTMMKDGAANELIRAGHYDGHKFIPRYLAALRRGMELAADDLKARMKEG